jgi:hypothetical protein
LRLQHLLELIQTHALAYRIRAPLLQNLNLLFVSFQLMLPQGRFGLLFGLLSKGWIQAQLFLWL